MAKDYSYNEIKDLNVIEGTQVYHVRETVIRKGSQAVIPLNDHNGNFMCYVVLHDLKGTQGEGVADAERLKLLSFEHKFVLDKILEDGETEYLSNDLFKIIELKVKSLEKEYNVNAWKRIVSELLHWDCFVLDMSTATYTVNQDHCEKLFKSGEFTYDR